MCSMSAAGPSGDLTTRARIRNAAIAHFASDGFQKANLRAIAATAGVSSGLVIHHFGDKDGLRRACDDRVLELIARRIHEKVEPSGVQDVLREYLSGPDEYQTQIRYMGRAIEEDAPAADTFVTRLVDETETALRAGMADGAFRPSTDPRAVAVLSVLMSISLLTMPPSLARCLGHERLSPEVLYRIGVPTMEVFTHGLYTDDTALRTAQQAWARMARPDEKG